MSDDRGDNQPNESVQELTLVIKMNIEQAPHAILGHSREGKARQTAAAFRILITRGALKTCESCAIAKAKQKNMNDESEGEKADKYNGRVYHDIHQLLEFSLRDLCNKVSYQMHEVSQGIFLSEHPPHDTESKPLALTFPLFFCR